MRSNHDFRFNASLSCMDLGHIQRSIQELNEIDVHTLHYNVVDGIFNDCFIFGDILLPVIKQYTNKPISVHLACQDPSRYIEPMIRNGADEICIHYEANIDCKELFKTIHSHGIRAGLAFQCDTKVPDDFIDLVKEADHILKLTVHPGYTGQSFHQNSLEHIQTMRFLLDQAGMNQRIEVDGNINKETINACIEAGADTFTLGSSGLFCPEHDLKTNLNILQQIGGTSNGHFSQ